MIALIQKEAEAMGFARAYFLPPVNLSDWEEHVQSAGLKVRLQTDIPAAYPWATCVILLIYPYSPFPPDERIPAYYVAHNSAYHAANALKKALSERTGKRFEHVSSLPVRALALKNGIGVQGKNGLLRIDPYGSRFAPFALLTDACLPQQVRDTTVPCPEGCMLCAKACPTGAIGENAVFGSSHLTQKRCMRCYMNKVPYPEWVYPLQVKHIGCEACMDACPYNKALPVAQPSEALREAFDLDRLMAGDTAEATKYIGKNMRTSQKLAHEACYFKERKLRGSSRTNATLD